MYIPLNTIFPHIKCGFLGCSLHRLVKHDGMLPKMIQGSLLSGVAQLCLHYKLEWYSLIANMDCFPHSSQVSSYHDYQWVQFQRNISKRPCNPNKKGITKSAHCISEVNCHSSDILGKTQRGMYVPNSQTSLCVKCGLNRSLAIGKKELVGHRLLCGKRL